MEEEVVAVEVRNGVIARLARFLGVTLAASAARVRRRKASQATGGLKS